MTTLDKSRSPLKNVLDTVPLSIWVPLRRCPPPKKHLVFFFFDRERPTLGRRGQSGNVQFEPMGYGLLAVLKTGTDQGRKMQEGTSDTNDWCQ